MILPIAVLLFTAGAFLAGCDSSTRSDNRSDTGKGTTPGTNVRSTNENTYNKDAQQVAADYRKFRVDAEDQLSSLDKQIITIRKRLNTEAKTDRDQYERKLEKIEKRTSDLKQDMEDFKDSDKSDKVDSFKKKWNDDYASVKADINTFWTDKDNNKNKTDKRDNSMNNTYDNTKKK